ncbi:fimbria/pilus outer membrane usher protein [Escherichia coli]
MTNLAGVYGTCWKTTTCRYSVQTGYAGGGDGNSGNYGYATLNYRGGYGNANIGYSHSDDLKQLYYGVSGRVLGSCQWRNAGAAVKRFGGTC